MENFKGNIYSEEKRDIKKIATQKKQLQKILKKKNRAYIFFDIDGVLVKNGIFTPNNKTNLKEYFKKREAIIKEFKKEISLIKIKNLKIGIVTGRGQEFIEILVKNIFPKDGVDLFISEMGAIVFKKTKEGYRKTFFDGQKKELIKTLKKTKNQIEDYSSQNLEALPEKKEVMTTLFPIKKGELKKLESNIKKYLKKEELLKYYYIQSSKVAVDIIPLEVDKQKTINKILGNNVYFYFGDSKPDEKSILNAFVGVVPSNGVESTKKYAMKTKIGILPQGRYLSGVVETLKEINRFI